MQWIIKLQMLWLRMHAKDRTLNRADYLTSMYEFAQTFFYFLWNPTFELLWLSTLAQVKYASIFLSTFILAPLDHWWKGKVLAMAYEWSQCEQRAKKKWGSTRKSNILRCLAFCLSHTKSLGRRKEVMLLYWKKENVKNMAMVVNHD
jgi:hypothetical protein